MIPLCKPFFDDLELGLIKECMDSGWVAQGPKCGKLSKMVCDYLGAKYCIPVCNCTAALHLSLLALEIKKGDEVLVGDYSYPATALAILHAGAKPVFVDIEPETFNFSIEDAERKITKKTAAVMPVHTFGNPCDMTGIMDFAQKHDLYVIEDAACALGAKHKGKFAGTFGHTGCFSLHARKGITTGEGGLVVTDRKELYEKIKSLSMFGVKSAYEREGQFTIPVFNDVGFNYKMSDITAAIAIGQLSRIDKLIEKRRKIAEIYKKELSGSVVVPIPETEKDGFHIYQSFPCLIDKKYSRNDLVLEMRAGGVQCQIGTFAMHMQPVFKDFSVKCPVSRDTFERCMTLPMYYEMSFEDAYKVVSTMEKIFWRRW